MYRSGSLLFPQCKIAIRDPKAIGIQIEQAPWKARTLHFLTDKDPIIKCNIQILHDTL